MTEALDRAPDLRVWSLRVGEGRLRREAWPFRTSLFTLLLALTTGTFAVAQELPSGQSVTLHDSLLETPDKGANLILRYIAPRISRDAGDLGYDAVASDMDALCATDGHAAIGMTDVEVAQIMIVLMDRPVPRGQPDPDATQFISVYRPTEEGCEWQ